MVLNSGLTSGQAYKPIQGQKHNLHGAKLQEKQEKKGGGNLWGEARAFKGTVKMPTIFKRPLKFFLA